MLSEKNRALIESFGRGLLPCLEASGAPVTIDEINALMNAARHQAQEEAKAVSVEGLTVSSATAVIGEEQSSVDWGVQPTSAPNQHTRDRIAELDIPEAEMAFRSIFANPTPKEG